MRRLLIVMLLLPLVAACTAKPTEKRPESSGTTPTTESETFPAGDFSGPTTTETFGALRFDHLKSWLSQGYEAPASLITYLSTNELSDPCNGNDCGWPLEELEPGQPLIIWSHATTADVSRHRSVPGPCSAIHGDLTLDAQIGTYKMRACLRGPDLDAQEEDVYAMLTSVRAD